MNTADATTRMQRKDSAKGSRAVERKLKLCPTVMTAWGVQRSDYGKGRPAFGHGSRVEPWRPAPTRKGARVLRHRGLGSPPTGGVCAIGGSRKREATASGWRGSGKLAGGWYAAEPLEGRQCQQ